MFRGGLYTLDETVVLGSEDSGESADRPITYKSAVGERATFRSGAPIATSAWRSLTVRLLPPPISRTLHP